MLRGIAGVVTLLVALVVVVLGVVLMKAGFDPEIATTGAKGIGFFFGGLALEGVAGCLAWCSVEAYDA